MPTALDRLNELRTEPRKPRTALNRLQELRRAAESSEPTLRSPYLREATPEAPAFVQEGLGRAAELQREIVREALQAPPDPWRTLEIAERMPTELRGAVEAADVLSNLRGEPYIDPNISRERMQDLMFRSVVLGEFGADTPEQAAVEYFRTDAQRQWRGYAESLEQWREEHRPAIKAAQRAVLEPDRAAGLMRRARKAGQGDVALALVRDFQRAYAAQGRVDVPQGFLERTGHELHQGYRWMRDSALMSIFYGIGLVNEDFHEAAGGLRAATQARAMMHEELFPSDKPGFVAAVERGYFNALNMAIPMVGSLALGGVGGLKTTTAGAVKLSAASKGVQIAYWTTLIFPDEYGQMLDAGVDRKIAAPAAIIDAALQGAIEMWGTGRVAMAKSLRAGVRRRLLAVAKEPLKEWGEEVAQGFTGRGIRAAVAATTGTEFDWEAERHSLGVELKAAAFAIPFLMGPGSAVGVYRNIRADAEPAAAQMLQGLENMSEASRAVDPLPLVENARQAFAEAAKGIDLAPPPGLAAAEAAVEGEQPVGRLQQRLAEGAAAAVAPEALAPQAPEPRPPSVSRPVAAERPARAVEPRTPREVKADAGRAGRQAKALEDEVIAQYEADTGESIETMRERALGGVVAVEGEPVPVEGFTGDFAGSLPGEVTDRLTGMSFGKRMRYRRVIKANVSGGTAEDFVGDLPGGYDEFFERVDMILEGRRAGMARGVADAKRWGMDTLQYDMVARAEAVEQLRSTKEPIADIDRFVTNRVAELRRVAPEGVWAEDDIAPSSARAVARSIVRAEALPTTRRALNKLIRRGRLEVSATLKDMREIANVLPTAERHKMIAALSNITGLKAGVKAFVRRVNKILDTYRARQEHIQAIKKYQTAIKAIRTRGRLRPEFQKKFDALVDSFTEHTHTDRILNRLRGVIHASEVYLTAAATGTDVVDSPSPKVVERAERILAEQGKVLLRKLPPEAIGQVADAITHIGRLNELKNHLLIGGHLKDLGDSADRGAKDVRKGRQAVVDMTTIKSEDKPSPRGPWGWARRMWLRNHRLETLAAKMTRVDSPAVDILARQLVHKATNDEINIQQTSLEGLAEALKASGFALDPKFLRKFSPAYAKAEAGFFRRALSRVARRQLEDAADTRTIKLPGATYAETGQPVGEVAFAPAHIADLLGHFWAPDNLSAIVSGVPVYFEWKGRYAKPIHLTWADVRAIEAAATPAERAVRDYIVEDCNAHLKNAVNKVSVEWAGFELLRVDRWYSRARAMQFQPQGAPAESLQYWENQTIEGQGWTKERTGGSRPIMVRDALDRYLGHLSGGSRYAAWLGPLRNARVLLNHPTFAKAVSRHYGSSYLRLFRRAYRILEDPSFGKGGPGAETMSQFIGNMYKGILGFRPHIAGYQFLSYSFIGRELPARDVAAGLNLAHKANYAKLREHSGILYQRFGGVGGTRTAIIGPAAGGARLKTMLTPRKGEAVMSWISGADRLTLGRISVAVESYIGRTQPDLKGDDFWRAVATKTEEMVVHNQPSFTPASRSLLALDAKSGDAFAKVVTLFSSVRESIVNQSIMDDLTYRDGPKTTAAKAKWTKNKLILLSNFALVAMIADFWFRAIKGFRKAKEPWQSRILRKAVSRAFGVVFFFGDIGAAAWEATWAAWHGQSTWQAGMRANPLSQAIADGIAGGAEIVKGLKRDIKGMKPRERVKPEVYYWRGMNKLARTAGVLFGLPVAGVSEIIELGKTLVTEEKKKAARPPSRKRW